MALYTPAKLYAGTPGTTSATLYTVPGSTKALIKQITLSNTTATAATVTLVLAGTAYLTAHSVPANTAVQFNLAYPLVAGELITGLQATASAVAVHITGVTY